MAALSSPDRTRVDQAQAWLADEAAAVSLVLELEGGFAAVTETTFAVFSTEAEAQAESDRRGERVAAARDLGTLERMARELCVHSESSTCDALGECVGA